MSKKALGKGIGALINASRNETESQPGLKIDIGLIQTNPDQPRKVFSEDSLRELAASIREKGVIQPVIVERNPDQTYLLIAGERRYRAAKMAGLQQIPVIVKAFSDSEKIEIALIENIQREDLTPIEEATAYEALMKLSDLKQDELATHLGKNRSTIANSLRLLKLPAEIKAALNDRTISAGHARAILAASGTANQAALYKSIVAQGLSVREAESLSTKLNTKARTKKKPGETAPFLRAPELDEIKQKLIDLLGTKIEIRGTLEQGKIEISYFSADDLDRIYEILLQDA